MKYYCVPYTSCQLGTGCAAVVVSCALCAVVAGASEPFALDRIDRGRTAKRPLVDWLSPDGRSVDLVDQVRGKRAVGRLGRDQPQVRAYAGEQVGTGA